MSRKAGAVKFPKSWLGTLPLRQKIHHFFFSHTWGTRFKYLPEGCPYMLMYSALHIMQWFSHILDVFTRKSDENVSISTFWCIKTNVAYTRLEVIAKQRSALQVEFITGVKLICYFVLYYCFLHWAHLPNMVVGDLAFYYTLYLWILPNHNNLVKMLNCMIWKKKSLVLTSSSSDTFKTAALTIHDKYKVVVTVGRLPLSTDVF